jgi:hypothetical protein
MKLFCGSRRHLNLSNLGSLSGNASAASEPALDVQYGLSQLKLSLLEVVGQKRRSRRRYHAAGWQHHRDELSRVKTRVSVVVPYRQVCVLSSVGEL